MTLRSDDTQPTVFSDSTKVVVLGLFAASFHILADIPNFGGMPVRLGASDTFLLIFLVLAAFRWRHLDIPFPRTQRSVFLWLAPVAAVMVLGFLRGPRGDIAARSWAAVKLVGFFVLAAYFMVGWATALKIGAVGRRFFCRSFVVAAWACTAYALLRYFLAYWQFVPDDSFPRMAGFARNPNAFGLLTAVSLVMQLTLAASLPLFPASVEVLGAALLLLGLYLSASRSAVIAILAVLLALALLKKLPLALLARSAATATAVFVIAFLAPSQLPALTPSSPMTPSTTAAAPARSAGGPIAIRETQYDVGVKVRIFLAKDAIRLWRDNPVLGGGLGGFLHEERRLHQNDGSFIYVNHNSALWILSEMGIVGLIPFVGFFLSSGLVLFREVRDKPVALAILCVLLLMAVASLGGEVLYQRYLWFLLGLGIAECFSARSSRAAAAVQGASTSP